MAAPPPPVINPSDRISKLPEEIQAQILSFLPAQEAVRTCVLARTWRHVWKFTRRLLITVKSVQEVREFVDRLLRVRLDGLELACLDASEIRFNPLEEVDQDDEDTAIINRWICRVLECQIQILRVDICAYGREYLTDFMELNFRDGRPADLVSQHLTRLELKGVYFGCDCLNLDGCPALEHLEINECRLEGLWKIASLSLKHLVITSCYDEEEKRIQICVPRLVSLWLNDKYFRTPLLERMPELVGATVRIGSYPDRCDCDDRMACYHVMRAGDTSDNDSDSDDEEGSEYAGQNTTKCVVLEGLAQARDLLLIADHSTYIFRRDLRWCPTFSKLKTLVLNDYWCESTDCSALACMLKHTPVLEKLTVLFSRTVLLKYDVVIEGRPVATGKSTMISQHLKIVEVRCVEVHQRVLDVLKFLGTIKIWFQVIVAEGSK